MSEKLVPVKKRCSLQTWILKQLAVGVTNPAPWSLDLGQMLTCWRMEWEKCTSLPRAKGGWAQEYALFCNQNTAPLCYSMIDIYNKTIFFWYILALLYCISIVCDNSDNDIQCKFVLILLKYYFAVDYFVYKVCHHVTSESEISASQHEILCKWLLKQGVTSFVRLRVLHQGLCLSSSEYFCVCVHAGLQVCKKALAHSFCLP